MHYAAIRKLDDQLEVLRYLLDPGHSVDDIIYQTCGDESYFHMYSGIGAPLHYAAGKGRLDSVKLLVHHRASPQISDPLGQTAATGPAKIVLLLCLTSFTPCLLEEIPRAIFSSLMHPGATSELRH